MRTFFFTLFILCLVTSCDDGDVITADLDFDQGELTRCENNNDSYLIYDTRNDPSESLSILIPRNAQTESFFMQAITDTLEVNMSTIRFNYRTYNRNLSNNELCNIVTPADLNITEDFEAQTGAQIVFTSTIIDDDLDGIPSEDEGRGEADADGNFPNAQDTDGDGIPDYLDEDDDNDNVPTIDELDEGNLDGDNNPLTNPLNTDADIEMANGINPLPNYLDPDDDGDGVPTIDEDENQSGNPDDDRVLTNGINLALYLNFDENTNYGNPGLSDDNSFQRVVTTRIVIRNFNIDILQQDNYFLGTLTNMRTIEN